MESSRGEFLRVGDLDTHLFRSGEGEPLLYLHGIAPVGEWLPFHERLAERFALTAPDHPGFGFTDRPEWVEGIDDLVLHYDELLTRLELERPHLVGFSLGGWLAAQLAVTYPERFRSLTLINAAGLHVDGHLIPDIPALSREAVGEAVFHDPDAATAYFQLQLDPERRLRHYRALTTTALIAWNPWFDPKLERRLRRVRIPTLCLWAEHDRLIPPVYGERYHAGIAGSRLQIVRGCGHMAILERPDEVAAAVAQFCDELA